MGATGRWLGTTPVPEEELNVLALVDTVQSTPAEQVGERIRTVRNERRLSLRALAERSGLSASFLSQVERGLSSISLTSLREVAEALSEPIVTFVSTEVTQPQKTRSNGPILTITRAGDGAPSEMHPGARSYELLSSRTAGLVLEPLIAHFAPGGSREEQVAHEGEEFAFVLKGELTYLIDDVEHVLRPGDSIHLVSDIPHSVFNNGSEVATVLSVMTPRLF